MTTRSTRNGTRIAAPQRTRRALMLIGIALGTTPCLEASAQTDLWQLQALDAPPASVPLTESMSGSIFHSTAPACDGNPDGCWHFAQPATGTYEGGRFVASVTTRPIYVLRDAKLYVDHALTTENLAPYDAATISLRCLGDTSWQVIDTRFHSHGRNPSLFTLPASAARRLCQLRFAFDSVDGAQNAHAGWRIHRVAQWIPSGLDSDIDGVPSETDNCPDVANANQEPDIDPATGAATHIGEWCALRSRGGLIDAVAGTWHQQDLVLPGSPPAIYSLTGAPPGLDVDDHGRLTGTPTAGFDGTIRIQAYAGPDYAFDVSLRMVVREHELDRIERAMLIQQVARPRDMSGNVLDLRSAARFVEAPALVFATSDGIAADGSEMPGRASIRALVDTYVPYFLPGLPGAYWASTVPTDGSPFILIDVPPGGSGPRGGRCLSGSLCDTPEAWDRGHITHGWIELPADWYTGPPLPFEREATVAHELGHVFSGPHTYLEGVSFAQQRGRMVAPGARLGPRGHPLYHLSAYEVAIYEAVHRMPVGTSAGDLVAAGLVHPDDLYPPPIVSSVAGMRWEPAASAWVVDSTLDLTAGGRIAITGAHFNNYWSCESGSARHWFTEIDVPGGGTVAPHTTTYVNDGCTHLQVPLPATATSGWMVVRAYENTTGDVRESKPFWIEVR